jgi:ABC-type branched-subunit amino acid transport system substrate-binding protein
VPRPTPIDSPRRTWVALSPERRRRRRTSLFVVVACLAGALVFHGPVGSAGTTSTPLRVGGIVDGELYAGAGVGASARFAAVNADGGVRGRTIELVGVTDDHRSPDEHAVALGHLLDDERVDAVVPLVSSAFAGVPALERAKVPAFGWGISGAYCGSTWVFAITGCLTPLLPERVPGIWGVAVARLLEESETLPRTAAIVADDGGADRAIREVGAVARAAGLRVVHRSADLPSAGPAGADIDGTARSVLTSDDGAAPAVVFTVSGYANVAALQSSLRAQGFTGVLTNLVQYAPELAGPAAGVDVLTQFATPESASDNPAMQRIVAEIGAVTSDPITPAMLAGWFAADLFVDAARRAGPDATAADIRRSARRSSYAIAKTIGPTRFPGAFTTATSCGQLVVGDGTAYSVAVAFDCSPPVPVRAA